MHYWKRNVMCTFTWAIPNKCHQSPKSSQGSGKLLKHLIENFVKNFGPSIYIKGLFFYETRQKNLKSTLAGKLNLNWPYSPALPQRPKFKYNFPAKVD